jgi:hypothetical protein
VRGWVLERERIDPHRQLTEAEPGLANFFNVRFPIDWIITTQRRSRQAVPQAHFPLDFQT